MKKLNTLFFLVLVTTIFYAIPFYGQPSAPTGKKWQPVTNLSDEFNGTFDTNKWTKTLWDYPNTPTKMIAANATVSNGNLQIKATLNNNAERWFQASRVQSVATINYPMYTEARIRTAHLSAYNTFWLNSSDGDPGNRNEIDIIENNSRPSCNCQPNFPWQMNSQYFHGVNGNIIRAKGNFDNRNLSANNPKRGIPWNEEYHIVGVWWKSPTDIQFYLDGEEAGSVKSGRNFTKRLNVIFDLWTDDENFLGGAAVRSHLNNNNINTMYVDWVRTYQLVDAPNSNNYFHIQNRTSGKFIRPQTENGNIVQAPNTWRGSWTQWEMIDIDGTYFHLKNRQTGKYLRPETTLDNSQIIQSSTANSQWQTHWEKVNTSNGYFFLRNRWTFKHFRPIGNDDLSSATGNNFGMQLKPNSYTGGWTQWRFLDILGAKIKNSEEGELLDSFNFYPNPALNVINLKAGNTKYYINIYDLNGRSVINTSIQKNSTKEIAISNLNSGVYFVEYKAEDELKSSVKKLVKK